MTLHMHSSFGWNTIWQLFQTDLYLRKSLSAFYISTPRGCWWGFFGNMTIFLGLLSWSFILFDMSSLSLFFSFLSFLPPSSPHPFSLSFLPFLPSCLIWWWAAARYRKKTCYNMKPLFQCHKSPINGEQRTGCSLRIHFFASSMLLLFPSCDIYFSFLGTSDLRAAGMRSVVRITTDLSLILSCLIWKNIGIFSFPASFLWEKFLNYWLNAFIQICMSGF